MGAFLGPQKTDYRKLRSGLKIWAGSIGGSNKKCGIILCKMKTKLKIRTVVLMTGAALACVIGLSSSCTRQRPSALKPIDQAALQTMVDASASDFRIPSNTKTMTAAVIVLLAQENKLRLDDPVSKYVPGVPDGDRITITELL